MPSIRKTSICLAAIGLITCASSANSHEPLEPLIKKVSYADLDVDSSGGARTLYARLRHAAASVCLPLESRDPDRKNLWQMCYSNALGSAVTSVNKCWVTRLHQQSTQPGPWINYRCLATRTAASNR